LNNKQKLNNTNQSTYLKFEAIGTHWVIEINEKISKSALTDLSKKINNRIAVYDKNYSRFRSDSLVMSMFKKSGDYKLPEDAKPLFDLYQQLYVISDGIITPLIGQLISEAGYDANYSFKTKDLHSVPTWEDSIEYKYPDLSIKQPVLLDIGAAGKGYLVDIVASIIAEAGVKEFLVNAGGDIIQKTKSNKSASIGLEHPLNFDEVIGVANLKNQSICGSAGNRRSWGDFHHIINPKTKSSPKHILAVWVIADSTLLADGLATTLFFIDADVLHKHYSFEYALINNDLSLEYSNNFPADFFSED
jgi:thiamine biosynthesis lipoprotein